MFLRYIWKQTVMCEVWSDQLQYFQLVFVFVIRLETVSPLFHTPIVQTQTLTDAAEASRARTFSSHVFWYKCKRTVRLRPSGVCNSLVVYHRPVTITNDHG